VGSLLGVHLLVPKLLLLRYGDSTELAKLHRLGTSNSFDVSKILIGLSSYVRSLSIWHFMHTNPLKRVNLRPFKLEG
jgi:hypothetical protein